MADVFSIIVAVIFFLVSMIPVLILLGIVFVFIVVPILMLFLKIINQYEKGILFSFGKYSGTRGPGLNFIIPIFQELRKVDTRIMTIDIPKQEVMTKDNVPVAIDAVIYFKVVRPEDAIIKMEDYTYAVAQYAKTACRDVVGNVEMDELLTQRKRIADDIEKIVDKETGEWGIDVTSIKLQNIELPDDMKRSMARQAEAEREKRATIIMSEGELAASDNLAKAADILGTTQGAMHLRTLSSLDDVSADQTNKLSFFMPVEALRAIEGFPGLLKKKGE